MGPCADIEQLFILSACVNGAVFIHIKCSITNFTPAVALKPLGGAATAKYNI